MQWLRTSRLQESEPFAFLFYSRSCERIASEMVELDPEHFKLGEISWDKVQHLQLLLFIV